MRWKRQAVKENNNIFSTNRCQSLVCNIYASHVPSSSIRTRLVVVASCSRYRPCHSVGETRPYSHYEQFNLNNRIRIINPFITYNIEWSGAGPLPKWRGVCCRCSSPSTFSFLQKRSSSTRLATNTRSENVHVGPIIIRYSYLPSSITMQYSYLAPEDKDGTTLTIKSQRKIWTLRGISSATTKNRQRRIVLFADFCIDFCNSIANLLLVHPVPKKHNMCRAKVSTTALGVFDGLVWLQRGGEKDVQ